MPALWIHSEMYPLFIGGLFGGGVSTGTPLYCKNQPDTKPTGRWGQKSSQISVAATQTMKNKQTDEEESDTIKLRVRHLNLRLTRILEEERIFTCTSKTTRFIVSGEKNYMRSSETTPPLLLKKHEH